MNNPRQASDCPRQVRETRRGRHRITSQPWWPRAKRLLNIAFFTLIAYLLWSLARSVEWEEVFETIHRRPIKELATAAGFAAASYALYSCFDLLGRFYTGHKLSASKVLAVNFISYAFNLNLGSLIGGVAFRYKLYSRLGLSAEVITRVVAMSMTTNWLGYLLLGGLIFCWAPFPLPSDWNVNSTMLRLLGLALAACAVAYLLLCATMSRRRWIIKGSEITLPSLPLALIQLTMSCVNWMLMAVAIYMLLEQQIAYTIVLGVLLVAAVAGVITHIPAGLGVLEAVFVSLLSHEMTKNELLAALLMYRAMYYLVPLFIALLIYLFMEAQAKNA